MSKKKRSAPAAPAPMGKARGVAICVALVAVLAVWFVRLTGPGGAAPSASARAAQLAAANADLRAQLAAAKARGGAPAVMEAREDAPAVAAPSVAACDIPGFLMWLDVGGGQMHSALSIETSAQGQRRVVAARGAVAADQVLVYVPRELTLRAPHGLTEPFAALRLGTDGRSHPSVSMISFDESDGSTVVDIYALAATLIAERSRGTASKWAHYVQCLPGASEADDDGTPETCPSIFCATDAELEMLQSSTYVAEAVHDRDAVETARRAVDWSAAARGHGLSTADLPAPSPRLWRWAVSMVLSRKFRWEARLDEHYLVPVGDMLNHEPLPAKWPAMAVVREPAGFLAITPAPVYQGEEVHLQYVDSAVTAWNLLRTFGFVAPGGAGGTGGHTAVRMSINPEFDTPAEMRRVATVLRHVAPDRVSISNAQGGKLQATLAFSAGDTFDAATLGFCRVLANRRSLRALLVDLSEGTELTEKKEAMAAAEDRAMFGTLDKPLYAENEAAAFDLAFRSLDTCAAEWAGTTTLAEDEALLQRAEADGKARSGLSARALTHIEFRLLRKRVDASSRAVLKKLKAKFEAAQQQAKFEALQRDLEAKSNQ